MYIDRPYGKPAEVEVSGDYHNGFLLGTYVGPRQHPTCYPSRSALRARAKSLVRRLLLEYTTTGAIGSMTCSVYDTAWVACVSKPLPDGSREWAFPSAYLYVLRHQRQDGSWRHRNSAAEAAADSDPILSTLAGLRCLLLHDENPLQICETSDRPLESRIRLAAAALQDMLRCWRVLQCDTVGLEILVPALLDTLSLYGYSFDFPEKQILYGIRRKKLSKLPKDGLYKAAPCAILHSLEAFASDGEFSYDSVSHHKFNGSMMASPSATAAYLMNTTSWDGEAEAYLNRAISHGSGKGNGGLPSAYPSTNFELLWVLSNLLEAGFRISDLLDADESEALLRIMDESLSLGGGLLGFAPGVEPDLDDSAKCSEILIAYNRPGLCGEMIAAFSSTTCLRTYQGERTPSFSANCNALYSLVLGQADTIVKDSTVSQVLDFICTSWLDAGGPPADKWNTSPYYPSLLMSKCLLCFLQAWTEGRFRNIRMETISQRVWPCLLQCLSTVLLGQRLDGSWGASDVREETCYAVSTLAILEHVFAKSSFAAAVAQAISRGRTFLVGSYDMQSGMPLWIEKTKFSSENLTEAYFLAAMYVEREV